MSARDEWIENRPDEQLAQEARTAHAVLTSEEPVNRYRWWSARGTWLSVSLEAERRGWPSPLDPPQGTLI